jgi:O-acetyl-ADP-ribose deacetylase (regulator of RNase III)
VSSAGKLNFKYILHAVGPVWKGGTNGEDDLLRKCVQNCLKAANDLGVKSIAMPALSSGIFRYPLHQATRVITEAIRSFDISSFDKILLVDIRDEAADSFRTDVTQLFGQAAP